MSRYLDYCILRYESSPPRSLQAAGWRLIKATLELIYVPRIHV